MAEGTLITESLRVGATLEGFHMGVSRIHRERADLSADQAENGLSPIWTLIEFSIPDDETSSLAEALSHALESFGWYANFQSETESFVVFSGRAIRYKRGDPAGRMEAQAYGRTRGVPEAQLNWTV